MNRVPYLRCPLFPLAGALCAAVTIACGGGQKPDAENATDVTARGSGEDRPRMSASAEIGALDEDKVTSTFNAAQGDLQRCLLDGSRRNEHAGGDVAFFVKIDKRGRVAHAHLERSTIGDRETEKCMLRVLEKRSWPAPQGGDMGLARSSIGFDPPSDARPPTDWAPARVDGTLKAVASQVNSCRGEAGGELTATVYVDPDGAALTVGAAASDEAAASAIDCVIEVLKGATYPSPGSWPAKVTFTL